MIENIELNKIIGLPCQKAWDGLFPSIFLEFGEKVTQKEYEYDSDWEYRLGIDIAPWRVILNENVIFSSTDVVEKVQTSLEIFKDKIVEKIDVNSKENKVIFTFSGNLTLETSHENLDDELYLISPSQILTVGQNCKTILSKR